MVGTTSLVALAASISQALAAYQGFNYGSTFTTGAAKVQSDFEAEFATAQGLVGAPGIFNSARLYTTIQGGTANQPISAIPAAISTKTTLLLGMWCSAGDAVFANEIQALKSAISTYGSSLASNVAGISVGSEDLYRISPTGILNKENPGTGPAVIAGYISQVRDAIAGTPLSGVPVGHVDTWTAWVNSSNQAVIDSSDFIGVDAYPYFQNAVSNGIANGASLLDDAIGATQAAVGSKEVWVTETGWPVSGPAQNLATASIDNAKTFWDDAGCPRFGKTNIWWYTLQDAAPDTPSPSFGIIGNTLTTTPIYDLSCSNSSSSSSSSSSAAGTSIATASGSASASASSALSSLSAVASASGSDQGSPGISAGVGSSAASGGSATVTGAASSPSNGSSGSGSGSGSGTGIGSGSGAGSSGLNGTVSTGTPGASASPSSSLVTTSGATAKIASFGATLVSAVVASLVL